jgi:hypothetical protein
LRTVASTVLIAVAGCAHAPGQSSGTSEPGANDTQAPIGLASGTVFVGCGFLFVGNEGHVPFSALMRAGEAKQVHARPGAVVLDGVLIEASTATAAEVGAASARGVDLLAAHQKWEADYIARQRGGPALQVHRTGVLDFQVRGVDVIAWEYQVPGDVQVLGETIERVGYLTAAIDDAVFALTVPLRRGDDARVAIAKAGPIMKTIKRLPRPLDLVAISTEAQRNPGGWPDCQQ